MCWAVTWLIDWLTDWSIDSIVSYLQKEAVTLSDLIYFCLKSTFNFRWFRGWCGYISCLMHVWTLIFFAGALSCALQANKEKCERQKKDCLDTPTGATCVARPRPNRSLHKGQCTDVSGNVVRESRTCAFSPLTWFNSLLFYLDEISLCNLS